MELKSWTEGETRAAIVDFVERVTTEGGADFVPPATVVSVKNDWGTVSAE